LKKIYIIYAIVVLIFLYLLITYIHNLNFIFNYNKENYDLKTIIQLERIRPFSYISYYNLGNTYFMNENYDKAISCYELALELFPPEEKECKIRINLALAKFNLINFDITTEDQLNEIISELEEIIDVLTEEGCAHKSDSYGHSKDAQKLKNEIDSIIKSLRDPDGDSLDSNEDEEEQEKPSDKLNDKEQQLRDIQAEGTSQRNEKLDTTFENDTFDYIHYRGKKW